MKVDLSQRTIDELREVFKISMEDRDLFMKGQKVALDELCKKDEEINSLKLRMDMLCNSMIKSSFNREEVVVEIYDYDKFYFKLEDNVLKIIKRG